MGKISFTVQGDRIMGSLFVADGVQRKPLAFLLIHGWQGHQNIGAAQALADLGCTSLTYDMRGNGESEGELATLSRADFLDDAAAAYDYLRGQVGEHAAIGIVGSSFGSYLALLLTGRRKVACLSLRVPASYPDEGFDEPLLPHAGTFYNWRCNVLSYTENRAFNAMHNFTGNVQLVEAENDELVPHQAVANYISAIADKRELRHDVMKGAPHSLVNERLQAEYVALLTNWVKQQLAQPPVA